VKQDQGLPGAPYIPFFFGFVFDISRSIFPSPPHFPFPSSHFHLPSTTVTTIATSGCRGSTTMPPGRSNTNSGDDNAAQLQQQQQCGERRRRLTAASATTRTTPPPPGCSNRNGADDDSGTWLR
jgi:hypothetical protein